MLYFTGIQHTKSGDIVIPTLGYENYDDCKQKCSHEMDYAISNKDFLGLTILVFDGNGNKNDDLSDNWIRQNTAE